MVLKVSEVVQNHNRFYGAIMDRIEKLDEWGESNV